MPKKQVPVNFIIKCHIYPFDVMVSIGETDEQVGKHLDKHLPDMLTEDEINSCRYTRDISRGEAVMFGCGASFLRIRKLPSTPGEFGTLAHEIFHIATFIMNAVGMKLKLRVSDEAYAYLIGYLTKEIYERTNKYY